MGLFNWVLGKETQPESDVEEDNIGFARDFIRIPSRDFFGQSSKSPDGRYTLAWLDGGPNQSRHGRWILFGRQRDRRRRRHATSKRRQGCKQRCLYHQRLGSIENLSGTLAAFTSQERLC